MSCEQSSHQATVLTLTSRRQVLSSSSTSSDDEVHHTSSKVTYQESIDCKNSSESEVGEDSDEESHAGKLRVRKRRHFQGQQKPANTGELMLIIGQ